MARDNIIDPKAFSHRLKYYASIEGHDQSTLQRALGVRWATVHAWWVGKSVPKGPNLRGLGEVLGVTIDELLGIAEGQDPPFEAWRAFMETEQGRSATEDELTSLRSIYWKSKKPTVASYMVMLQGLRSAEND